jgi:hypothetical protein
MTHNDTSHFLQGSEVDPLGSLGCESEKLLEAATFPFSRLILVDCRIGCSLVLSAATVSSIGHRLVCVGEHPCRAFIVAMSLVIACRVGVVVDAGRAVPLDDGTAANRALLVAVGGGTSVPPVGPSSRVPIVVSCERCRCVRSSVGSVQRSQVRVRLLSCAEGTLVCGFGARIGKGTP